MGVYYTLKNGEQVKIRMGTDEGTYKDFLQIVLFGGSMSFEYEINKVLDLNKILESIEKDYQKLKEENDLHFYEANGFYD